MKSLERVENILKTSPFTFPDVRASAIERYSPRFHVRSPFGGSLRSKSMTVNSPSPETQLKRSMTSPDEVFMTPTTCLPSSLNCKTDV